MKDSIKREQNGACSDSAECENVHTKCKVLILQGSPRANGNTAWMAEEYKKAAESAGHDVTLVNVSKKKIAGCLACEYCHNKGNGACIQKDDMQELYPLMAEADVLV